MVNLISIGVYQLLALFSGVLDKIVIKGNVAISKGVCLATSYLGPDLGIFQPIIDWIQAEIVLGLAVLVITILLIMMIIDKVKNDGNNVKKYMIAVIGVIIIAYAIQTGLVEQQASDLINQ